jgi:TldD protein
MNRFKIALLLVILVPGLFDIFSLKAQDSLLVILTEELEREMTELSKQKMPPYYIDYRVDEIRTINLSASFGSLVGNSKNTSRVLTTNVKIGDYTFDNTHEFKGDYSLSNQSDVFGSALPLENEPDAIKQTLWRSTDQAYKNSVSAYAALSNRKDKNAIASEPHDFSKERTLGNKY